MSALRSPGHRRGQPETGGSPINGLKNSGALPVFVVSGPSGAGKTSLCVRLCEDLPWLRPTISYTTRKSREGESDGQEYFFVSKKTFEKMIKEDRFLEWAEVHGKLYGSSLDSLQREGDEQAILFEVDCKGAEQIRNKLERAVLIFVMTPTLNDLVLRLKTRGNVTEEDLSVRLRTAIYELQQAGEFDYLVINDRFDDAVHELQSVMVAETCRTRGRLPAWRERWDREMQHLRENPSE